MISAVCKSPAEVFSHSLQSKLETLGCGDSEDVEPGGTESRSWFLRSRGFSAEMRGFPMPGTTFPPSNGIHFDLLRAKYHSESDLAASKSPFKKDLFGKDEDEEDCSVRSIEADGNDSDLFFDFDIESPDEDSDGAEEKTTAQIHAADNSSAPENCLKRRNSVDSCISSRGGDLTKASTAFGSASSGLWSDSYDGAMQCNPDLNDASVQQAIEDDLNTCLSLDPEDWLAQKRQQHNYPQQQQSGSNKEEVDRSSSSSNSTPITAMSPANMSSSPLVSPDSLLDETPDLQQAVHDEEEPARNETNKDDVKDEESDDEDGNPDFTNIGTAQVAKSKLDALIALLEKDRSFGSSSSESKKPAAPRQNSLEERRPSPFAASGSRAIPRRFSSNLPTIAASPANFSFLSPPKSPSSGQLGKKPVRDESPKTSPSRKKNPGSEEDFPSKSERLRRASSLKSGKTPPGSPGHSKFVR